MAERERRQQLWWAAAERGQEGEGEGELRSLEEAEGAWFGIWKLELEYRNCYCVSANLELDI